MKIDEKLTKLLKFVNSAFPILTIYLGRELIQTPTSQILLAQLHSLIHKNLTGKQQKIFQKDIEKIESYLIDTYDKRSTRSLVFFTSGDRLWEVLDFEFYLRPQCVVFGSPYLSPLYDALDEYKKYLVLIIDRAKAKFFTVHLGKVEEEMEFKDGEVPQRVKAKTVNFGRVDKIMRHIDEHLHNHLKSVAQEAKKFIKDKGINFIVIGGHQDLFPKLKKVLPYPLNKMVIGEFITGLKAPTNELIKQSKKVIVEKKKAKYG